MRLYRGFDCGRSGTPVRDVMRAETHAHVLRLKKHLVTPGTALPADAGGLGAAEGLAQVTHVLAVDEAHAGLDGRCDAVREIGRASCRERGPGSEVGGAL